MTAYVCAFILTLKLAKLRTQVHMTCHNSACEQKEKSDIFELVIEMLEEIKEKPLQYLFQNRGTKQK